MSISNQARDGADTTHIIELAEFQPHAGSGKPLLSAQGGLLDSVPVALTVSVGEIASTVGELLALKEEAVLKIGRAADAPIDLILNGQVLARGQLVVVDEHFGLRITQVAGAAQ